MLLVWGSGLLSDVGTWVQLIVVGSLVARETGSALYTGLTALALFTPQGVCAPIGGLLADRYDRRKVFVGALLGQAVATAALALVLASGVTQPLLLAVIIVFSSAAGALGQPAYSAMLPDLVPPEELMAMVSLGIYSWNGGRIIGPILGTILVVLVGPSWTVAFNAITFALMALAVSMLRKSFMPPGTPAEGIRARLREGWNALEQVPGCRYGIVSIMILNVAVGPFMALIPIYVREIFGGGTAMAGTFSALQGAGAIVGGLLFTVLAVRFGRDRMLIVACTALCTAYIIYALAPTSVMAGAAIIWMGAGSASIFASSMTIVQRDAPDGERGRILSLTQCGMGLCYGLGVLWISVVGDWSSLRLAFLCACGVAIIGSVTATRRAPDWREVVEGDTSAAEAKLAITG